MNDFYRMAVIQKTENHGCSAEEAAFLTNLYIHIAQSTAKTLAREAYYNLEDFYNTKANNVDQFSLKVRYEKIENQEQLWGTFEDGNKIMLEVMATLIEVC